MKETIMKIYMLLVCGIPKKEGNYSRYYTEKKNWIFEAGCFRSLIIDLIDRKGCWASHPIDRLLEEAEEIKRKLAKKKFPPNKLK